MSSPRKGRSEAGEIDGVDLEPGENERAQTGGASAVSAAGEVEPVDQYGQVLQGVISCDVSRGGRACDLPP